MRGTITVCLLLTAGCVPIMDQWAKEEAARLKVVTDALFDEALAVTREMVEKEPVKRFGAVDLLLNTVKVEKTKAGMRRLSGEVVNVGSREQVQATVFIALRSNGWVLWVDWVQVHLRPGESKRFVSEEHSSTFELEVADVKVK
jgi:hypothetical protein